MPVNCLKTHQCRLKFYTTTLELKKKKKNKKKKDKCLLTIY